MEYKILFNSNAGKLVNDVNDLIERGWEPLGGPSVCERDICQGMIRKEPKGLYDID